MVYVNDDETTWQYHFMQMNDSDSWKKMIMNLRKTLKSFHIVSTFEIEAEIPKVERKFFYSKASTNEIFIQNELHQINLFRTCALIDQTNFSLSAYLCLGRKKISSKKTSHEQSMSIKIINYDPISTAITLIVVPNKEISRKLQRYNLE